MCVYAPSSRHRRFGILLVQPIDSLRSARAINNWLFLM